MLDFEYSLQYSYKKTWKKLQAVQWRLRTFCWKPQYFEDILRMDKTQVESVQLGKTLDLNL